MRDARTRGWIVINRDACSGCALCIEVCPAGCLSLEEAIGGRGVFAARFSGDGCRADGLCADACPEPGAITLLRSDPGARASA